MLALAPGGWAGFPGVISRVSPCLYRRLVGRLFAAGFPERWERNPKEKPGTPLLPPGAARGVPRANSPPPRPSRWGRWFCCLTFCLFPPFFFFSSRFPGSSISSESSPVSSPATNHSSPASTPKRGPMGPIIVPPGGHSVPSTPPVVTIAPTKTVNGVWRSEGRQVRPGQAHGGGARPQKKTGAVVAQGVGSPSPSSPRCHPGLSLFCPLSYPPHHVPRLPAGEEGSRGGGEGAWGGGTDDDGDEPAN